jgi:probable arsenate reductase (glutaredoxin)
LEHLKNTDKEYEVIDYLKKGVTTDELKSLLNKLQMQPIDLVRTKEAIWKEFYQGKTLTDEEVIAAMVAHPQLIQRPIVVEGDKAHIER